MFRSTRSPAGNICTLLTFLNNNLRKVFGVFNLERLLGNKLIETLKSSYAICFCFRKVVS